MDVPAFLPPLTRVRVSEAGQVWLRREAELSDAWRWTILDLGGQPIGQAAVPRSVQVRILHEDRAWGVETDELGVPWVVRYGIRR